MSILKYKKLHALANDLKYGSEMASGFDICNIWIERIHPGEIILIETGIAVELPNKTEMQIRPRSGISLKHPNYLANSIGTIDEDYRGELKLPVVNNTNKDWFIYPGTRLAQCVVVPVERPFIMEVSSLSETDRGANGFGSTGQ